VNLLLAAISGGISPEDDFQGTYHPPKLSSWPIKESFRRAPDQ
jgi:hypothetical protein